MRQVPMYLLARRLRIGTLEQEHLALRASANQGKPPIAATDRAGDFHDKVVAAKDAGAPYRGKEGGTAPSGRSNTTVTAVHPKELSPVERPTPPSTGNAKQDKKYQQQQEKLYAQQEKERQQLQKQQDKEHAQLDKQKADAAKKQQVEEKHQQQTQAQANRHAQQREQLQSRQTGGGHEPKK